VAVFDTSKGAIFDKMFETPQTLEGVLKHMVVTRWSLRQHLLLLQTSTLTPCVMCRPWCCTQGEGSFDILIWRGCFENPKLRHLEDLKGFSQGGLPSPQGSPTSCNPDHRVALAHVAPGHRVAFTRHPGTVSGHRVALAAL